MKKQFKIDIWKFLNVENVNDALDKVTEKEEHIAADIGYKCLEITKDGTLTLEAEYTPEDY